MTSANLFHDFTLLKEAVKLRLKPIASCFMTGFRTCTV